MSRPSRNRWNFGRIREEFTEKNYRPLFSGGHFPEKSLKEGP
jgi:hypothetical protein